MSTGEQTLPYPDDDNQEPIHLTQALVDDIETAFTLPDRVIQTQEAYFEACSAYFKRQTPHRLHAIEKASDRHIDSFGDSFMELTRDIRPSEAQLLSNGMIWSDDHSRADFLNELCGKEITESVPYFDPQVVLEVADEMDSGTKEEQAAQKKGIADLLFEVHHSYLDADNNRFVDFANSRPGATKRRFHISEESLERLQDASINIAEITAGTALGLIIARRFFK